MVKRFSTRKIKTLLVLELNVVNNGKDYVFPIHSDSRDKLLSVVIYIAPEVNEGTWLYEDKSGKNPKQVEWILIVLLFLVETIIPGIVIKQMVKIIDLH